jgi:glycine/D-amino acid oxidase-like deaminating enzyme
MPQDTIFHPDFKAKPFWWEAYAPAAGDLVDVPREAPVVMIGAGYAGLSTALELARNGIASVVLDANEPGFGGSTRNGGMVSGGVSVGKRYAGKDSEDRLATLYGDAADSFSVIEDLIAREKIDCEWTKSGRFGGAWCRSHYEAMQAKADKLNRYAKAEAYVLPKERQREEIGSDLYMGGLVTMRSAHLHPAKYYRGLIDACRRAGVTICAKAAVTKLERQGAAWKVETTRGTIVAKDVVVGTNGYTGEATPELQRRVIPLASYIIATEELPDDLARSLMPNNKSIYDTRRVLTYYRMSGDRKRLIFGGRAKFGPFDAVQTAPILYRIMTEIFPQLKGSKITHAWTGNVAFTFDETPHMGTLDGLHYALGCNGSGVAMMTYLGTQTARKIAGVSNYRTAFETDDFPTHWAYNGNPWYIPWVGRYFRARDWIDRRFN